MANSDNYGPTESSLMIVMLVTKSYQDLGALPDPNTQTLYWLEFLCTKRANRMMEEWFNFASIYRVPNSRDLVARQYYELPL